MKIVLTLLAFAITSLSIFENSFKEGYYYTNEDIKVKGLIRFRRATLSIFDNTQSNILFKENDDSKSIKLTTNDISSFVIGTDSFAVVYDIKINSIEGEYEKDFAEVIVTGKMNLYVHLSASYDGRSSYDNDRYVLSKDNKSYIGIWDFKKQRNEIAELFSDNADIKAKILTITSKEFYKHFPELVKEYNSKSN